MHRVLNIPGMENQYCNPNSENCDINTVKSYGGCIKIIAEGFQTENMNDMSCSVPLGLREEPTRDAKVWERYPVWESHEHLGAALRAENIKTVGGLLTCENAGEVAGKATDIAGCIEGDLLSCTGVFDAPEIRPGEAVKDIVVEKGTGSGCEGLISALGVSAKDTIERYKGYFQAEMEQWCSEYGELKTLSSCPEIMQDYDNCAEKPHQWEYQQQNLTQ